MENLTLLYFCEVLDPSFVDWGSYQLSLSRHPALGQFRSRAVPKQRVVPNWIATFALKGLPASQYRLHGRAPGGSAGGEYLSFKQRQDAPEARYPEVVELHWANTDTPGLQGDVFNARVTDRVLQIWVPAQLDVTHRRAELLRYLDGRFLLNERKDAEGLMRFCPDQVSASLQQCLKKWSRNHSFASPTNLLTFEGFFSD